MFSLGKTKLGARVHVHVPRVRVNTVTPIWNILSWRYH